MVLEAMDIYTRGTDRSFPVISLADDGKTGQKRTVYVGVLGRLREYFPQHLIFRRIPFHLVAPLAFSRLESRAAPNGRRVDKVPSRKWEPDQDCV